MSQHARKPIQQHGYFSSTQELRLYTELLAILPGEIEREVKVLDNKNFQVDILIPKIQLIIEYDGYYWHRDKKKDLEKNKAFEAAGYSVLRIRDSRLVKIHSQDIHHNSRTELDLLTIQKVCLRIVAFTEGTKFLKKWRAGLEGYLDVNEFVNQNDYHGLFNKRFAPNHPISDDPLLRNIVNDWDSEKNHGHIPSQFGAGSSFQAAWKCATCSHEWSSPIYSRCAGFGCPACAGQVATTNNNLLLHFPEIESVYNSVRNTCPAESVLPHSEQRIWIDCPSCESSYEVLTKNLTQSLLAQHNHGLWCSTCKKKNVLKKTSLAFKYPRFAKWLFTEDNAGISAAEISAGSERKYIFRCPQCQDPWLISPNNLTSKKPTCCPCCKPGYKGKVVKSKLIKEKTPSKSTPSKRIFLDSDEKPNFSKLGRKYGLHPETIRRRWNKGKRGADLTAKSRVKSQLIVIDGKKLTVDQAAKIAGVNKMTIYKRLRNGKTGKDIIAKSQRKNSYSINGITYSTLSAAARAYGYSTYQEIDTIRQRLKNGWSLERALQVKNLK